jgi:hypothetical protein
MNKEGFIKYSQLISNDDQEPEKNYEYIINKSYDIWKTAVTYHSFVSRHAFSVFDRNHDGVIDFAEFLFMLACNSNSDWVTKYGSLFEM